MTFPLNSGIYAISNVHVFIISNQFSLFSVSVPCRDLVSCGVEKCGYGAECNGTICGCQPGFVDLKIINRSPGSKYCLGKLTTNR